MKPSPPGKRPDRRPQTTTLHPRNRHQGRYDFAALVSASPGLAPFIKRTPDGERSIDFASPVAVRALNRALLAQHYGITQWDIPAGYLCPPVPGRADYVHGLADLLAGDNGGAIPQGSGVRVLDIGVGANCIYPLIGTREYGWRFVGTDIEARAVEAARTIVASNPGLDAVIELRHQPQRERIFAGVIEPGEHFDVSMCNPPFHASAQAAAQGTRRKLANLHGPGTPATLNFGGRPDELWCPGGEAAFLGRMIDESAAIADRICWFSSLLSRADTVPAVTRHLRRAAAVDVRVVPMAQGSKQSRFVAWTFMDARRRHDWHRTRAR
jgi:23S rRNA (adenine1618-N6)-methyltransferase